MIQVKKDLSEAKNQIVAHYPLEYILSMVSCTIIGIVCLFIVLYAAPPDKKAEIVLLLLGIITICAIISVGFKRYKITINGEEVSEIPIIGKRKQIKFTEIKDIKIKRSKAIVVLSAKKKIYIDPAVTEYTQIMNVLSERGLMQIK